MALPVEPRPAGSGRMLGRVVRRKEDPRLITGTGTYVDDLRLPGTLHMAVVRSPHAHARITGIDADRARRLPGVRAVITGADIKDLCNPIPVGWSLNGLKVPEKYPLAIDRVRHVGEAVAAVVADSAAAAVDAAEAVEVTYQPLPAVIDPEAAMAEGAAQIWDDVPNNVAARFPLSGGDIDAAFRQADRVVKLRAVNQRLVPVPIEPRGVLARAHPLTGELTLWSSTQVPHLLHALVPGVLNLSETRVRIVAPNVGGGFGCKLNLYAEEMLAGALSLKLGRPVKWIERRSEHFAATVHGRDQVADLEAAVTRDGRILGVRARIIADIGAYHQLLTPAIPTFTAFMMTGVYAVPALDVEVIEVFTNKMPTDAYRGAGRPEAAYFVERLVDCVARDLGLDPVEVRRRNFVQPDQFPYTTASGLNYDSGNYPGTLDRLLAKIDYDGFRREQQQAREQGRLLGIGFSTYVEICGLAPSRIWGALGAGVGGWESATVRISAAGRVTVVTGTSPHGQGHETSWAQIVADALGVDYDDVEVLHGDTAVAPHGLDTYGSRSAAVGGTAVHLSAVKVREKARRIAAHLLEASVADVEFEVGGDGKGRFYVKGAPQRHVTLAEVASNAFTGHNLPDDIEPGLDATTFYDPTNFTYPFGAHACIVEVDPDDGRVQILRYVAVDDCGHVINPQLVEGQVHGGLAQGIAQALYEGAVYDEQGQLLTASLGDYAVPTAASLPSFETDRTVTPSPTNPLGVKGVGEAGTIASPPCVVNAVVDALAHLGVRHIDMPLRPARVWAAIQEAMRSEGGQPA
ncbi:MAG TPA: molybdopterin cofactor-binding domain-containing protein [Bacillota bacterium]